MSSSKKEIPGFYRDPESGKFYKDDPASAFNPVLKKLKKQREIRNEFITTSKLVNVVPYLNAREIQTISSCSKEYLKTNCSLKQERSSMMANELKGVYNNSCIDFLIGSGRKLCAVWFEKKSRYYKYALAMMDYKSTDSRDWKFYFSPYNVIDMCEGLLTDEFLRLYNYIDYNKPLRNSSFRENNGERVETFNEDGDWRILSHLESLHRQMFCCSSNKNRMLYAFGCKDLIGFKHINDMVTFVNIEGKVHTISFDGTGNLMVAGVHTGELFLRDLRSEYIVASYAVSKSCLVDSSMTNFPNIIIGGADDVLCNFDIRKNEIVTEYFNHKQAGIRRAPISVTSEMLCARGTDNKIRIWEASTGGLPIHIINPQENHDINIQGWLHSDGLETQLNFFEGINKKVFDVIYQTGCI